MKFRSKRTIAHFGSYLRQLFEVVLYNDLKTIENSFKLYNRPFWGPFEVFAAHFPMINTKEDPKTYFTRSAKNVKNL